MKTELQKRLAPVAPSIAINTHWNLEWKAWSCEVRATAVLENGAATGAGHLSGAWEKTGENPDMAGHEMDLTEEALLKLRKGCRGSAVLLEIEAALVEVNKLKIDTISTR